MPLRFRQSRRQKALRRIANVRGRILDAIYSPVISRLTHDQYFACRTRNDCLRTFVRARLAR